jgi:hypothetical protein
MGRLQALPTEISAAVRQAVMANVTSVMRIEVTGDVGYLFFLEGELVHASTLEHEGERAVTAILAWGKGEPGWCERRWPKQRTVQRSWNELAAMSAAPAAASFEQDDPPTLPNNTPAESEPQPEPPPEVHFPSSFGLRQTLSRAEFKNALRIGRGGNVGDGRGGTAHLKPILLSSFPLGDSLGAVLGLGPLIAAEASAPGFHRLVARSSEDVSAAETGGGSALQLARAFLKL